MFQFITLLLTAGLLSCEAKVFHVTPTLPVDQTCPPPCHTLDQYAQYPSLFAGHTNVSLVFMEGVHNLSHIFELDHCDLLEFRGASAEDTVINLLPSRSMWLAAIDIRLYNIRVDSDFTVDQLQSFTANGLLTISLNLDIRNSSISVMFSSVSRLNASIKHKASLYNTSIRGIIGIIGTDEVMIQYSVFPGVLLVLDVQSLVIFDCKFTGSQNTVELNRVNIDLTNEVSIQNVTVSDAKALGLALNLVNNVTITNSIIANNTFGVQSVGSNLNIRDTEITGNKLGVVIIEEQSSRSRLENRHFYIKNCTFSFNDNGGLALINLHSATVQITDCSFHSNHGTPITAYQSKFELRGETTFRDNTVRSGGGLALVNSTVILGPKSNTMFVNNTAKEFGGAIYIVNLPLTQFTKILVLNQNNVLKDTLTNLRYGLEPAPISSVLYGQGQRWFYVLDNDSYISFAGNKATLGGYDIFGATIYTEEYSFFDHPNFRFSNEASNTYKISSNPMRVCFCTNNVPQCENRRYLVLNETRYSGESFTVSALLASHNYGRVAGTVYTNVLGRDYNNLINENQRVQSVDTMECRDLTYRVSSSQTGDSVVLVLTTQEQSSQLQDEEEIETNIYSDRCSDNGTSPCIALLTTPIYINVTLEACPLGFELDETTGMCDCEANLAVFRGNDQAMITCTIRNRIGYITREGTVWMGVDTSENNTDIYYWHRYCPRDYCNGSQISIDMRSPDTQCSSNRAGVLCGRCRANYSLQLGGNKCLNCNNSYVALLIVFAVLGILLVALIKLLDLTVSSGTINGLIFYANVLWRNNAILFFLQAQNRQSIGYYIITVPIAWINLDFGMEACFTENLDQLTKTGLQFVFPVYIWCIAGLIILISHYSTRATKLFGNNSVSVLATLFLLSYGKLFRNITDVFTYANVPDSNGTTHKVWSLDGNIRYGGTAGHVVLIVVALLFLILFLLPFTLTLLLVPFLRAKSHLRPLRWINTLKPFFDTYYGPFKDKRQHQVWTGILLVSRVLILIVFASTSTYSPNANILLMTLVSMLLLTYSALVGLLYRKWHLSLLEHLYLLNLMMLGGTFLFYQPTCLDQENPRHYRLNPVTTTSVVIALLLFILTVIIYTAKRVLSTERVRTCLKKKRSQEDKVHLGEIILDAQEDDGMGPTVQIVSIKKDEYDPTQLREMLLEI